MSAALYRLTVERVATRNRQLANGAFQGIPPRGAGWRAADVSAEQIVWEGQPTAGGKP